MERKHILLLAGALLFIGGLFALRQSHIVDVFQVESLKNTILGFGVWAPLIYIGFYTLASLLFIPGSPLTLLGGALFGPWYGTLYTIIGATFGALLAFLFSRTVGRHLFSFGSGKVATRLKDYDQRIATHGFLTVLFLRFVPLFPFNGLNFGLGFTSVSLKDYFFGTFLGIIPGTFAYVYFGDSLATLSLVKIASAIVLVVALSFLGKFILGTYGAKNIKV